MGSVHLRRNKLSKVFVVNKGAHDYSKAERFGELVFCTDGTLSKFDLNQMYRELTAAMREAGPDDWILLTSLTTLCSVACAIFGRRFGRLNLLIFKDNDYVERRIILNDNATRTQDERSKRSA